MFRAVWKVAKNFVDPITVKKFKLVGDVPLADMKKAGIPLESIPKYMGGKGDDPIGYHYKLNVPAASCSSLKTYVNSLSFRYSFELFTHTNKQVCSEERTDIHVGYRYYGRLFVCFDRIRRGHNFETYENFEETVHFRLLDGTSDGESTSRL